MMQVLKAGPVFSKSIKKLVPKIFAIEHCKNRRDIVYMVSTLEHQMTHILEDSNDKPVLL